MLVVVSQSKSVTKRAQLVKLYNDTFYEILVIFSCFHASLIFASKARGILSRTSDRVSSHTSNKHQVSKLACLSLLVKVTLSDKKFKGYSTSWGQWYKTFLPVIYEFFVISKSVCPKEAFPA